MRALLIWGCIILCVLAVAVSSSHPSESGKDEGPQILAALIGEENGGQRKELSDWSADSPSALLQEARAGTPRKSKRRKCVGCFTALIVNDEAVAEKVQKKKIRWRKNPGGPRNVLIGRSHKPLDSRDGIESSDCNVMPPKEVLPFVTSSRTSRRERRSDSRAQPGKKVSRPPPYPPHTGRFTALNRNTKTKRHIEDGHGRHHRKGKKRRGERRERKREHKRKPKEEDLTKTSVPELSSVDGQVKEKKRHRGHDREKGHKGNWRSGSRSGIAVAPPSLRNTEPGDRKPWTELSRKRRQNNKKGQWNRPRPATGWGSAIASVDTRKFGKSA